VSTGRSLAIGLMQCPATISPVDRRWARVRLSLAAYDRGYVLVDTLEVSATTDQEDGGADQDGTPYEVLEQLATHTDAQAVFCAGTVDAPRIDEIAARVRLLVHDINPWG